MKFLAPSATLVATAFLFSACSNDSTPSPVQEPAPTSKASTKVPLPAPAKVAEVKKSDPTAAPPASPLTDAQRAAALWETIQGFKSWNSPPGFSGLVESDSVHGDYVRFYANGIALTDMKTLPNGSIVVKEGFHDDKGDLKAITAMQKIDGFSGKSGDWFFTRFDSVGKASKVSSNSCIRCHKKADNGDFSFAND